MGPFFKRKRAIVISLLLLLHTVPVFAQSTNYSLLNLIDSAKHYLPVLMQKNALINAARANVTDVRHSFLPQVLLSEEVNMGSSNSLAGSYFTFGITPSTSGSIRAENNPEAVTGNLAVVYSEYELATFGYNRAKLNNAKAYISLQETDLQQEQYFMELNIAKLYFNILRNQYRLGADRQNIDRYQSIFNVIQALAASGIKPGADSSLAKAELSKTKISYNQTLGAINQLKEQLAYLTGIPARKLDVDTLAISSVNRKPEPVDFAMDTVNNPVIDFYTKKKAIFIAQENLIRKSYLPSILLAGSSWARGSSIQYNDQYKSLGTGLGYQRYNYDFGLAVTYNLFGGIYKKDKLAVNRSLLQASEYELQQQKLLLQSSSLQADNALLTTQANLLELPVQLKAAEDTYEQKLAQYKAGLISLIDLTNASFVLYRSQTDYIETLNDWYLAQLDKAAATGNLIQFIQTIK